MTLAWLAKRPIAHRGLHDGNVRRYENTLSAFEAASAANYAIECDVVLAADGVPMVFHDLTLDRLTQAKGDVIARTSAELGGLAIGGTGDHMPTLAEALALIAARVPLIIELKGHDPANAHLVKAVADVLKHYAGQVAIMSFDHWLLRRFQTDAPGIARGLTADGIRASELEAHFSMLATAPDFVSYCVHHLPNPFVTFCRERLAMPVITWTVRTDDDVAATLAHADQMTFEGFLP
jgi:glycerophosphoryl diester phosphodiesterase